LRVSAELRQNKNAASLYFEKFVNAILGRGDYVFALILYVLLTILFTWPLADNFTRYADGSTMDVFHELWYLHLDYTSPYGPFFIFSTNMILYPYGVPLYFQVLSPLHALIGMPINYFFGQIVAFNFLYMFTFFVSAFTMFIFVKYLTNNSYAAFFAGIVFGFAPVHLGQGIAGHLNIMASELLPLFAYFLVKMVREQKLRNGIYAGILMALNAMLDLHFLLFCLIMTVSFLIFYLIFEHRKILNKPYLTRFFTMFVIAAAIGAIAYFQTLYGLFFAPGGFGTSASVTVHLHRTPDLLQYFLPGPTNPFLGKFTAPYYFNFVSTTEVSTYIGYTALIIAILGIIFYRRQKDVWFWVFLTIVAFFISLGPQLVINGHLTNIPGPWKYLELIPLFNSFRTPFRVDYLVAFGIAVLGGYGLERIVRAIENKKKIIVNRQLSMQILKILVVVAICSMVIIEYLPIPYSEVNLTIPTFYTQVLAKDHSNFTVLEVPGIVENKAVLYYQSTYERPLINGHISRTPSSSLVFMEETPFINQLTTYIGGTTTPPGLINQSLSPVQIAPYILAQYHIKYIIVHKDLLPTTTYTRVFNLISAAIGPPYYEDNLLTVFRYIPPSPSFGLADYPGQNNASVVSFLYGGWNEYGLVGAHAQTMDNSAGLYVYSASNQYVQLSFKAEGVARAYPLQLLVNGIYEGAFLMENGTYTQVLTSFLYLHQGQNQINFNSVSGCQPVRVGKTSSREICASVSFESISVVPASSLVT
jgi:hypothetical protein